MNKYDRYETYSWATNVLDFIAKEQKIKFVDYGKEHHWQADKYLELVDDLIASESKKDHFYLGSIVYTIKRFEKTKDLYKNIYEVTIVDGRQRLQSVMLLLLAIKNILRLRHEGQNLMEIIDRLIFSDTDGQRNVRLVFPTAEEQKVFEQLAYEGDAKNSENLIIYQNYAVLIEKLINFNLEKLNDVFVFLSENVYFVEISIRAEKNNLNKIYKDINYK